MKLPFYQVDVFTNERFCGNPLAVFLDADGVDDGMMQRIAREMNLSETTFVQTTANPEAAARVRIFTPGHEMPFAGHPTIGTAYVLHLLGKLPNDEFAFDMQAGVIPVRREGSFFWMTPPAAEPISAAFDRAAIAAAIGVPVASVMMPPQVFGSRGVDFLCILLDTPANVDWVTIDRTELIGATNDTVGAGNVLILSYSGGKAYSRMFADLASAIGEDPATGSSVAPLCAALAWWRTLDRTRTELTVEQGTQMGRKSILHARFVVEHTHVQQLTVGGEAVPVFTSTLEV